MAAIDPHDLRRGACPSLSAPMQTGDGLLSRLSLTLPVRPGALIALCQAVIRHGNGLIDISARGNLQARGLSAQSAVAFEREIMALALPLREGIAIDTGPLAGLDEAEIADPRLLAAAIQKNVLERELTPHLAPKVALVVDGGGRIALDGMAADIRLKAVAGKGPPVWALFLGGYETDGAAVGALPEEHAPAAALALLQAMSDRGPAFRGRDFTREDVLARLGPWLRPLEADMGRPAARPDVLGVFALRHGQAAAGFAPAFGQVHANDLVLLTEQAKECGVEHIRPAPGHALLAIGPRAACAAMRNLAAAAGFIIDSDDPRASLAACPGAPLCSSAYFPVRDMAKKLASHARLLDGSFTLHLSGCAKGCAHPDKSLLVLAGSQAGIGLTLSGRASDEPGMMFSPAGACDAFQRLERWLEEQQRPGESAAQCLRRLPFPAMKSLFVRTPR